MMASGRRPVYGLSRLLSLSFLKTKEGYDGDPPEGTINRTWIIFLKSHVDDVSGRFIPRGPGSQKSL